MNQSISESINLLPIFSFKKHVFVDRVFTLMLADRKQSLGVQELLAAHSIDIIGGEFNYGVLKVTKNKLSDIFADLFQIINKAIHISGSMTESRILH